VLDEGRVRIEHEGRAIATLGPAEVFGQLAILGDGHRRATVTAETDVRVFAMFGTRFREMEITVPTLAARLVELEKERVVELS
jgi:CRP-like cAMP-binding protein